MRLFSPDSSSKYRRLLFALLFSLILHLLLLFFVRFAQPGSSSSANNISTLHVRLNTSPAEAVKLPVISEANQNDTGLAAIGMQNDSSEPQQALTSTQGTPAEKPATTIPKTSGIKHVTTPGTDMPEPAQQVEATQSKSIAQFSERTPDEHPPTAIPDTLVAQDIITINKPAPFQVAKSTPALLAPPPVKPPPAEKSVAPGVAKIKPAAPADKLISAPPISGEKQEKIVIATSANAPDPAQDTKAAKPPVIAEPNHINAGDPTEGVPDDSTKPVVAQTTSATANQVSSPLAKNSPKLLVTQTPPGVESAAKAPSFAPMPSVDKLVSATPIPTKNQNEMVIAANTDVHEPSKKAEPAAPALLPKQLTDKLAKPLPIVPVEPPKLVAIEQIKPAVPEPKLVILTPAIQKLEPIIEPEPVKMPESAKKPEPAQVAELPPTTKVLKSPQKESSTEAPMPAPQARSAKPKIGASPLDNWGDSDLFKPATKATVPGPKTLGLVDLSIAAVRNLAVNDRKIRFGERRKTVSLKEQDLRYAMYVESVRMKLQRIGQFNYPAAATRQNLSGSLGLILTIRADGSLADINIVRPSAYNALNDGTKHIVTMCAPFSPLPDSIRTETDMLSIKINWTFDSEHQSLE